MASSTLVLAPIMGALVKAEGFAKLEPMNWLTYREEQERFLSAYAGDRSHLSRYLDRELRAWASWNAEELNRILAEEGFSIRLEDFGKDAFGVVSILDVLVEWLTTGKPTAITYEKKRYPAVEMKKYVDGEELSCVLDSPRHASPIVALATKSGDVVYMTIADKERKGWDLWIKINEIKKELRPNTIEYSHLRFPMVDLDREENIAWLCGMRNGNWRIEQALQQTKFKMNEKGARVKSAVAVGIKIMSFVISKVIEIDRPFFLWIERPGVLTPVMYAYLDTDTWKDPGDLENS